jgi:uncharacterized protein YdeI (YjbR/CyaY-like superfamily)
MIAADRFEHVEIHSAAELRRWLETHHTQPQSVWLVRFKKHVSDKYVSPDAVLDELLCFGWIDGRSLKLDADRVLHLISPRRVHHWALSYKRRAERLVLEGRMAPAGLAAIETSKRLGLWDLLDGADRLEMPQDLAQALEACPSAARHFAAFPDSTRRFALRWITLAKSTEARARRIEKTVRLAEQNLKVPGS